MGTNQEVLNKEKLSIALQRLELFLEPANQKVLNELEAENPIHLPQLSQKLSSSPYKLKKQLDELKAAGLVFTPKRYPKSYSVNKIKCIKINLRARPLVKT